MASQDTPCPTCENHVPGLARMRATSIPSRLVPVIDPTTSTSSPPGSAQLKASFLFRLEDILLPKLSFS